MTKLIKKRIECLDHVMRQHGIEFGNHIFISTWDAAGNLNNTWKAKHFVNTKLFKSSYGNDFALKSWEIFNLLNGIRMAARKSGYIKLRESHTNKSEFLQITKP